MMTYSQFVEYIEIHKNEYLPENLDAYARSNKQNNGVLQDGWALTNVASVKDVPVMIYFKDLYEEFCQKDVDIKSFLKEKITTITDGVDMRFQDSVQDRIFLRIVNAEKNQKILQDYPCKKISDFLVTYRLLAYKNQEGIASLLVDHELAQRIGLNEEELYQKALKNTETLFPAKFGNLQDVLINSKLTGQVEVGEEIHVDIDHDPMPAYILSNKECINGATSILYPKVQEELKREFPNGYYIVPSSIHELLLVDNSFVETPGDLLQLKAGVMEVNYTVLDPTEFLSDEIYQVKGPDFKLERASMPKMQKEKNMER